MEITELMIGDIVQYLDGKKLITVVVVKVDGSGNVVRLKQKNGHKFNTTIDFLRPKPLTDKILKKNGFEYFHKNYSSLSYDHPFKLKMTNWPDENGLGGLYTICDIIEIRFVHQLQHAFTLCKINKQISLP